VADHLWLVDFDVEIDGFAVEGARVVFRVNNGNLIQFGTENLPAPGGRAPSEDIGRKAALSILADHIGGFSALDTFVDGGTQRLIPLATGNGRGLARVWSFVFQRRGSRGTWRARIDAATGEILEFQDVNAYAQVNGGVHPSSYVFADETVLPMPYADLSSGGYANSAGQFTLGGGSPSSTLSGRYVDISDSCGPISQSGNTFGSIAFGTSGGSDCITPGSGSSGGGGNTHAARTQFYHLNRIKEVGRGWLPANSWLASQLPAKVNINSVCNAFWNGSSLNFYRSGNGCGNTGEIAAVSLHEYGHGLDSNDGAGFSSDGGTGEAYADVTAALMLRDSCVGPGFRGTNCGGYGDVCTSCTGVRDIDWATHASNTPHTVDNFTRLRCGGGSGACGREVHCESHVASEAIWDLAARDLPDPGSAAAWAIVERLWYLSRPTATSAFQAGVEVAGGRSDHGPDRGVGPAGGGGAVEAARLEAVAVERDRLAGDRGGGGLRRSGGHALLGHGGPDHVEVRARLRRGHAEALAGRQGRLSGARVGPLRPVLQRAPVPRLPGGRAGRHSDLHRRPGRLSADRGRPRRSLRRDHRQCWRNRRLRRAHAAHRLQRHDQLRKQLQGMVPGG
jgi:hypothetical protein